MIEDLRHFQPHSIDAGPSPVTLNAAAGFFRHITIASGPCPSRRLLARQQKTRARRDSDHHSDQGRPGLPWSL
jgi:hypothetical protein